MTKYKQLPGYWTPKQLKMQELLANPMDDRNIADKATEVGISSRMVYTWKRLPGWNDAVFEIARSWIGDKAPEVLRALVNSAKEGDPASIKLYLEIIGKYTQTSEIDLRVGRLEVLSDDELREIIKKGASPESGGGAGTGAKADRGQNKLLPAPQNAGEVSQEPGDN
ncbi:MAG: hypothetical protein A3G36_04420 [Omnitrophica bacterium RIFCSPLOWO2_12_FULL_45_13]|nr:MAG: hypothetical protein A3G36_04420 [Omnitrophica bacterium RIFCSPLOWO2_12_FULL_45_13]